MVLMKDLSLSGRLPLMLELNGPAAQKVQRGLDQVPDQDLTDIAASRQSFGLPVRAMQRQNQKSGEVLRQRVLPGQKGQLADDVCAPPPFDIEFKPHLERSQSLFFEPAPLGLSKRTWYARQRPALPFAERHVQNSHRAGRSPATTQLLCLRHSLLEDPEIQGTIR
ncbi:hypothetical protein O3S80_02535 [Streptomyces sp. Lzd4kr]|nr:hypothetical protein [Streptomyces sp. Lzd4kr]